MRPSIILHQHSSPLNYATQLIRRSDSDSLWSSFFYPTTNEERKAYLTLRAFNIELASIDDHVSSPMVGRMRYQWWRDTIKRTFENQPPAHPIAQLLHSLPQVRNQQLSSYHFTRLINSREAHFLNPSFGTLQDLADYSAGTQASLLYLLLQATASRTRHESSTLPHSTPFEHVGNEHDSHPSVTSDVTKSPLKEADDLTLDHAASHLAVTNTIVTLLRSIPHHAQKRINVIPTEIAARYDMREEELFRKGPSTPGLKEAVATMVGIAQAELKTARSCFDGTKGVPKRAVPVFLSATPARSWLERISEESDEKKAFDVFEPRFHKRNWKLPFQVWSDSRKGTF